MRSAGRRVERGGRAPGVAAVRAVCGALVVAACSLASCSGRLPVRASRAFVVPRAHGAEPAGPLATCPPAADGPEGVRCRWRAAMVNFSMGAAQTPVEVCVCDACEEDGHCRARPDGRCVEAEAFRGRIPAAIRLCTYRDEPCHTPCGEGHHCAWNSADDRHACVPTPAPAPYQ